MIKEFKIYDDNCNVKIDITEEKKTLVFEKILEWCKNHDCISGEKLCQNDECNIDSPDLLSDIIDNVLKFESEWDEE